MWCRRPRIRKALQHVDPEARPPIRSSCFVQRYKFIERNPRSITGGLQSVERFGRATLSPFGCNLSLTPSSVRRTTISSECKPYRRPRRVHDTGRPTRAPIVRRKPTPASSAPSRVFWHRREVDRRSLPFVCQQSRRSTPLPLQDFNQVVHTVLPYPTRGCRIGLRRIQGPLASC